MFTTGCGGKQVYQLEPNGWKSVIDLHLTLPAKTLLYGEVNFYVKTFRPLNFQNNFSPINIEHNTSFDYKGLNEKHFSTFFKLDYLKKLFLLCYMCVFENRTDYNT